MKGESMKRTLEQHPHMNRTPEPDPDWAAFWVDVLMALGLLGFLIGVMALAFYAMW